MSSCDSNSLDLGVTGDNWLMIEHEEWKEKTPFSYDFIISHSLPSYSNTVHWSSAPPQPSLSLSSGPSDPEYHSLLYNFYLVEDKSSYAYIAQVLVPTNDDPISIIPKVGPIWIIALDAPLSIARFMPHNPDIFCAITLSTTPDIFMFDCSKFPPADHFDPTLRLTGLEQYNWIGRSTLAWHPIKEGYVLGTNGDTICLWDINSALAQRYRGLGSMRAYEYMGDDSTVQDVQWHCKNENVFSSVGYSGQLVIWDLRINQSQQSVEAHNSEEVNHLSFHPKNEWLLATASSDSTVGLFDMRKLTRKFYTLKGHTAKAIQVEWDPNHGSVLASSGLDKKLIIWDINRIGDEKSKQDSKAPELLFSHGGHMENIKDFSWYKRLPWVISSVAEDNTLHVWRLAKSIYGDIATIDN